MEIGLTQLDPLLAEKSESENFTQIWLTRCQALYLLFTEWKFQDFSVIQILREINVGEFISSRTGGFLYHFRDSEYCTFGQFWSSKCAKDSK